VKETAITVAELFLVSAVTFFIVAVYTVIEFGFVFVLSVMSFYDVGENIQNSGATNVKPNRKKLYL
jgi:hypothetical protein